MVVLEILDLSREAFDAESLIRKVAGAFDGVKAPQHIVYGVKVQDKSTIQISSEWDDSQEDTSPISTRDHRSFINRVRESGGELQNVFHVTLNRSAFGANGPATENVVEYVLNYFPASHVTPEFQRQVEKNFLKFDEVYVKGVRVDTSVAYGWVLEEQSHQDVKGEKAKCFLVSRGWKTMDRFEQSLKTDAYKEAIPILLEWNAPWKMASILPAT